MSVLRAESARAVRHWADQLVCADSDCEYVWQAIRTQDSERRVAWKAGTHNIPSWRENAVTSRPEGKASKGMVDIWVGKSSKRRKGEKTAALYSITHFLITRSGPVQLR